MVFDCSALPGQMVDAELFGREHTGAGGFESRHVGFLERAHGGTLLLSNVTTLPLAAQVKLLRFLDSGNFVPAASSAPQSADVRIIAATDVRPATAVADGRSATTCCSGWSSFRSVPSLLSATATCERWLSASLMRSTVPKARKKRFSRAALARLQEHSWPGNVRELKNYVHRAYLHAGSVIDGGEAVSTDAQTDDTDDRSRCVSARRWRKSSGG